MNCGSLISRQIALGFKAKGSVSLWIRNVMHILIVSHGDLVWNALSDWRQSAPIKSVIAAL